MRPVLILVIAVATVSGCGGGGSSTHTRNFRNVSEAMLPTLEVGDVLKTDLDAYKSDDPKVGDIVVFYPPAEANGDVPGKGPSGQCGSDYSGGEPCRLAGDHPASVKFIKRIVAGPGDTIAIRNGHVILNGKLVQEDYIKPCHPGDECNFPASITIPKGSYYMLGDNRGQSDDSRFWGAVPVDWIIGKVQE